MKKLLGILGTITITGSAMSGIVGNAPAPAKNEINYSQINNLKNLNRNKRYIEEGEDQFLFEDGSPFERDRYVFVITPNSWEEFIRYFNISRIEFIKYFKNKIGKNYINFNHPRLRIDSELLSSKVYDHFDEINNLWKASNRNKLIKIVFYNKNEWECILGSCNYVIFQSFKILEDYAEKSNKYLNKMWQDFDNKLYISGDINLGVIEDDSNNYILNKLKEIFPKLDISQFEVIKKNQYSFLEKNFWAEINVKKSSNIYPIQSFKKKLTFITKKFLKEDLPRILGQENLIQNWNLDFNEWKNEINRQKTEDIPKYGNDDRGKALKKTWKGNHLTELKNKLLSLNHILETIDNKFKISELYTTVKGLQKDINDLKQQISELNKKIDNIKIDLEGNKGLENCTKFGSAISATTGWIPFVGTLVSTVSGTIAAICDIAN